MPLNPSIYRILLLTLLAAILAACGGDSDSDDSEDTNGDLDLDGFIDEDVFTPEEESPFYVSFNRSSRLEPSAPSQLVVVSSECLYDSCNEAARVVSGEDFECAGQSCELSDDMGYVVFQDDSDDQNLYVAELDSDLHLSSARRQVASHVSDFMTRGDYLIHLNLGMELGWYQLSTGESGTLGNLLSGGDDRESSGGFRLSDDGRWLLTYATSLSTLRVTRWDLESSNKEAKPLYRFVSGSATSAGSSFSGHEASAISPDGEWLVVHTTQMVLADQCDDGCPAPLTCIEDAEPARCGSNRTILNVIHIPDVGQLEGGCARNSDCGTGHYCDLTYISASTQQGTCMPGRLDLGPRDGIGCQQHRPGDYTMVARDMFWTPSGQIAFMALDRCNNEGPNALTPSSIRLFDPETREFETVYDTPEGSYPGPDCLDQETFEYIPSQCLSTFRGLRPSPSGQQALALGSTIITDRSDAIWLIDLFGGLPNRVVSNVLDDGEPNTWQIIRFKAHQ